MSDGTYTDVDKGYVDAADAAVLAEAKAYADALFASVPQPEPPDPAPADEPVVIYTPTEIAGWPHDDEYDLLTATWAGKIGATRPIPDFIPEHGEQARRDMVDSSIIVKCQAALAVVDGDQRRIDATNEDIEQFAQVNLDWSTADGDSPLSQSWVLENLVVGAWLLGSDPSILEPLLRFELEHISWIQGANWFGSECDAVLQIAYFLNDPVLIADAHDRFHFRIPQSIYHPDYDGDHVHYLVGGSNAEMIWPAVLDATGYANENDNHWNGQAQPPDGLAIFNGEPLPKGCGAERTRDIAHDMMGLYAWANCARTIRANGGVVEPHAHARIRDNAEVQGDRVLAFLKTGTIPDPVGYNDGGVGGDGYRYGWHSVASYLGDETPACVAELLTRPEVNSSRAGINHQTADSFVR